MRKGKFIAIAMALVVASLSISGCKTDTPIIGGLIGLKSNQIFEVDKLICSKAEYKIILMDTQNAYKKDLGGVADWSVLVDDNVTLESFINEKVKEDITVKYTLSAMATKKGVYLNSDEKTQINKAATTYYNSLNDAEKKYTEASEKDVEKVFTNYLLAYKVYEKLTESIGKKVTDEEARVIKIQYIRMNSDNTEESTINRTMRDVTDLVYGGYQEFSREAKQYSEDDLVEKTIKKNEAKEKYEIEAFELADEEISSIIQDGKNYYLVYCVNSYIEDLTIKNKESIIEKEKEQSFNKQYNEYLKEVKTDFNTKEWKKLTLSTDKNIVNSSLMTEYNKIVKK